MVERALMAIERVICGRKSHQVEVENLVAGGTRILCEGPSIRADDSSWIQARKARPRFECASLQSTIRNARLALEPILLLGAGAGVRCPHPWAEVP